ncbi:MAG: DNA-methyltransferase [Thermodesulfobacteriota bacterium]
METTHQIYYTSSIDMRMVKPESIDLLVTSPPYPMIEMWDEVFISQDKNIRTQLKDCQPWTAFENMHRLLDKVWDEAWRTLKPGGFVCINIGDAARTIADHFALYPNHARILTCLIRLGFTPLPVILWRKQTNAPNKFMGSGMLPAGAYVTLEHEYVLIARKKGKRLFADDDQKAARSGSAIFWEERNDWFSDVWMDLKGTVQKLGDDTVRKRSGAFPFELPYRLISMFSVKGDTVLDPFMGLGTTILAAMAAARNSIGYELAADFRSTVESRVEGVLALANERIEKRLEQHLRFVRERREKNGDFRHQNRHYGFPVITGQEKNLLIHSLKSVRQEKTDRYRVIYDETPQQRFCGDPGPKPESPSPAQPLKRKGRPVRSSASKQQQLTLLD